MRLILHAKLIAAVLMVAALTGCAIKTTAPYDYSEFRQSNPKSILVLPPLNKTPEVRATYSMLSHVTRPLAESGYYVLPVTLVDETFKENGLTEPSDMHALAPAKLSSIFGADAALYITMTKYGTVYQVINSVAVVAAEAKLVDLKTGKVLWNGSAVASSAEGQSQQPGGLVGLLVTAVVKQIVGNMVDQSHPLAGTTSVRLLAAGSPNGLLYGPRSAEFGKPLK